MLFNNVAAPFVVRVTCRGMFEEEEELLLKNPDNDSASGSVDTTSTPTGPDHKLLQ